MNEKILVIGVLILLVVNTFSLVSGEVTGGFGIDIVVEDPDWVDDGDDDNSNAGDDSDDDDDRRSSSNNDDYVENNFEESEEKTLIQKKEVNGKIILNKLEESQRVKENKGIDKKILTSVLALSNAVLLFSFILLLLAFKKSSKKSNSKKRS